MPLAVQPVTSAVAALAANLGVTLQPGTVVDARVLQILDTNLVRIVIANLTLDAPTAQPLQQGQSLQLAVAQAADGLTLTPVVADALPSVRPAAVVVDDVPLAPHPRLQQPQRVSPLTPAETQAVETATQNAATKQSGLSPLFANLSAAVATGKLPQPVLVAAAQLLGLRVPTAAPVTSDVIKAAVQSSGLTMESVMAAPARQAVAPDIKSALLVLRQALATWSPVDADVAKPVPTQPLPTNAATPMPTPIASDAETMPAVRSMDIRLAAAMLQGANAAGETEALVAAPKNLLTVQIMASALREPIADVPHEPLSQMVPPPVRGAPPAPQPVASSSIAMDAEPATIARHLIADTDGAIARQTLLQIASLPDRSDSQALRSAPAQPRWNFEIPFVTPQGTAMAQFEVARDGDGLQVETAQRIWRARFSLDIEPAGPVHALIVFGGDTTSVKMWAERPATAAQLRANAFQLTQSLDRADLKAGDIVVADGAPARGKVASGHFLNRAT